MAEVPQHVQRCNPKRLSTYGGGVFVCVWGGVWVFFNPLSILFPVSNPAHYFEIQFTDRSPMTRLIEDVFCRMSKQTQDDKKCNYMNVIYDTSSSWIKLRL